MTTAQPPLSPVNKSHVKSEIETNPTTVLAPEPQATPETIIAPILPVLPDPSLFTTSALSSDTPAYLLVSQARQNSARLQSLRDDIANGILDVSLTPPSPTSLPPLPPVPFPQHHLQPLRRSSLPSKPSSSKPLEKPMIPSDSPLSKADPSKAHAVLQAFNTWQRELGQTRKGKSKEVGGESLAETDGRWSAGLKHDDTAVCYQLGTGGEGATIWAGLTGSGEGAEEGTKTVGIKSVKVFLPAPGSKLARPPDISSTGSHTTLSKHLTKLGLTLPELLYRIPALPSLLSQACHYCGKYLRMPDGMPLQHTGWLPAAPTRGTGLDALEGGHSGVSQGRWVCWHDSCSGI